MMRAVTQRSESSGSARTLEAEARRGRAWVSGDATAVSLHPGFVVVRNALSPAVSLSWPFLFIDAREHLPAWPSLI